MVSKRDISKLLKKGLSGREVAKLITEDSWEVDHQRDGFLSEADIQTLKASLYGQGLQEYNQWIRVYQLVDYTLKDAQIQALEAQRMLLLSTKMLEMYRLEDAVRYYQMVSPAIVTQKQYDELKTEYRANRLQEILTLWQVIDSRAYKVAPQELQDKALGGDGFVQDLAGLLQDEQPPMYQEVVRQVIQLIREGKLQPVQADEQAIRKLKAHEQKEEELRARDETLAVATDSLPDWIELGRQERALLQASYKAAKSKASQKSQEEMVRLLEWYVQTSDLPASEAMSDEEQEKLLEYTYFSGEELYQAGLPEWLEYVDSYKPDWEEETAARPAGVMQSISVAIIQEPRPEDVDERGWYKDREAKELSRLSGYMRKRQLEVDGLSQPELLKKSRVQIGERIKTFLAIQAVIEAISDVVGVPMVEDLEEWREAIETDVELYNLLCSSKSYFAEAGPPYYLGMPELKKLKIGRLKPTARSLRYYRERMAMALGDNWWKEAIESLDFEEPEAESLAEELKQDFQAVREGNGSEEAHHGQE